MLSQTQSHNKAAQSQSHNHNQEIKAKIRDTKKLIAELEKNIASSEQRINEIDNALCSQEVLNDSNRIKALMIERDNLDKLLKNLYSEWEGASLELEELKN